MGTIADMQRAPWWPELIRVKDTMTWVELAARFEVHPATLRLAMQQAGVEKVSMPRGPKAKAALGEAMRVLQTEAGRRPDAEVAIAAGMSVEEVKAWRRERGIPPFLRPPPGKSEGLLKGGAAPAPTGTPTVIRRRPSGEGEPPVETRVSAPPARTPAIHPLPTVLQGSAPPAPLPVRPVQPTPPPSPTPSPVQRIEAHRADLGKVPDQEIADRTGVSRSLVGNYRRQLGISSYEAQKATGPRWSHVNEPAVEEPAAAVPAPVVEVPVVEVPVVEVPVVEVPIVEVPIVEVPTVEEQTTEEPPIEQPVEAKAPTPVLGVAPAPSPAPPVSPSPAISPLAFRIKAESPEGGRRFVIVAATMGEALARAEVALAARADGPWHVMGIRELSEALS